MKMEVKASERGYVRVFAVSLSRDEAARFVAGPEAEGGDWPLRDALGAEALDPAWVDLVHPETLDEVGLAGYLTQGLGVAEAELEGARERLAAITEPVVVLPSQAFAGTAQTLAPAAPLRWIGTFREEGAPPVTERLRSASAEGPAAGATAAPEAPGSGGRPAWVAAGLVALGVLVALVLVLVGLGVV